jgi:hypothetical protein
MVGDEIPHQLKEQLRQYVQTRDVVQLYGICRSNSDWQLTRLLDGASGQAYLLIARDKNRFPTILNLTGSVSDRAVTIDALDRRAVGTFIRSRARWLQPRSSGDGLHQSSPLLVLHGGSTGQSKGANIDPLAVGLTTDPQVEVGRE